MQQDCIRGWALATTEQWAAIEVYGLSLEPLASNSSVALWQEDIRSGQHFTECDDYLLRNIAKKHSRTLASLWMDRPSTYRNDDPFSRGLDHVPWKTQPAIMWLEVTNPTLDNLHAAIDHHLIRGVGYRHLVGATRYGSLLLLDSPEDPLPLSEMIELYNDTQVRI